MSPTIAVLGASGLIGEAVARHLIAAGYPVIAVARRFTRAQAASFGSRVRVARLVELSSAELGDVIGGAQIVVNCLGVLQDGPKGRAEEVHLGFVTRLLGAMGLRLLVHLSIPESATPDETAFAKTKRQAEAAIRSSGLPYAVLRPGFVVADAAYGGSAMIRALAALPFNLPARQADADFAVVDATDIARTVELLAQRWQAGEQDVAVSWDVLGAPPPSVGQVIAAFRERIGGPRPWLTLPGWLVQLGAWAGDAAGWLGWSAPVRSTARTEMRRGLRGDPTAWQAATGLEVAPVADILERYRAGVQEKWFARLYLLKPLIFGMLVVFWCVSGLIALTVAFGAAAAILTAHGFPEGMARTIVVVSSCADIAVGLAIAFRRTTRLGLLWGIAQSLFYMVAAALLTPDMWIEPLGALVKTFPAIVLMVVALAILDER